MHVPVCRCHAVAFRQESARARQAVQRREIELQAQQTAQMELSVSLDVQEKALLRKCVR